MSLLDKASLIVTPNGYKESKLYSIVPSSGAGDLDVVRATTPTRVNSARLIESVAVNIPRIDYTNGSCPSLLVEPQRTNVTLQSENLAITWYNAGGLLNANATNSPSGTLTADKIIADNTNGIHVYQQTITVSSATVYTMSIFVKLGEYTFVELADASSLKAQTFNLTTKTILGPQTAGFTAATSSKIEDYGNGWLRCSITYTTTLGIAFFRISLSNGTSTTFTGNNTNGLFVWGSQLESGSYATSYIPTVASSVTRNADVISKTGISSLIGQTEGTLFLDLYASAKNKDAGSFATWLIAGDATNNFQIYNLSGDLYWFARNTAGGIFLDQLANQTIVAGTRYKIAFAYKSGDYALYINGVQKRTNTNTNIPTVSQFNLSAEGFGSSPAIVKNEYNSVQFYKTRLTNSELASLTTI